MTSVDIYGRRYNIGGDNDPKTIQALAEYVDRRMRQIASKAGAGDDVGVAVMAALNIADDYYRTRKAYEQREADIDQRARDLAGRLRTALEPLKPNSGTQTE
jgi:cell division protein ZapA